MKREELIKLTRNINKSSCPNKVNFHCHTTFSDGSLKPDEILDQAYFNKLSYIAITDHHTVDAHKYIENKELMNKYPINSIQLVAGIEINCLLKGCLVHILGLGIDIYSEALLPYTKGESAIGDNLKASSVCKAIRDSGGLSFLAHPARYRLAFNELIEESMSIGFDGIEVWYDYNLSEVWEPSSFICEQINLLTDKYKMLKTCGTDSHGYSLLGR